VEPFSRTISWSQEEIKDAVHTLSMLDHKIHDKGIHYGVCVCEQGFGNNLVFANKTKS
jgi:hypothetical protein